MDLVVNEVRSFFSALLSLSLFLPEHSRLVNVQLIQVLTYRLMAHPLTTKQLTTVHNLIWRHIRKPSNSAPFTPELTPRVKYTPRSLGGLASRHFLYAVHRDTVNLAIRCLNGDGPPHVCESVRELLLDGSRSALQDTVVDTAQGLGLRFNTLGPWNPALPQHLLPGELVSVKFDGVPDSECPVCMGVVQDTPASSAKVSFRSPQGTEEHTLTSSADYMLHPPVFAPCPEFYKEPSLAAPQLIRNPPFFQPPPPPDNPPPPYGGTLLSSSPTGFVYRVTLTKHVPHSEDLLAWGCLAAEKLRQRAA